MSYSNHTISAPVSIRDVQRCFGIGKCDLGSLIVAAPINKWAKYKPVKLPTVQIITLAQLQSVNFGIVHIPTWTRLDYMAEFLCSNNKGSLPQSKWPECDQDEGALSLDYWEYEKPEGGQSEPFRLADFNEYYHDAEQPLGPMASNTVIIEPYGSMHIYFTYGAITINTLKLSDLVWPGSVDYPVANMYFGVLMKKLTGNLQGTVFAAIGKVQGTYITVANAANHGFRVDIDRALVTTDFEGTWQIFPLLSSAAFDFTSNISQFTGGKFLAPLPDHSQPIIVTIHYAQVVITNAVGYRDPNSQQRYVRVVIALSNDEDVARRYRVTVNLFDKNGNSTSYSGSTTGQVPANGNSSVTISIYVATDWASFQGGFFTATCAIDNSIEDIKFFRDSAWPRTQLAESAPL